MKRIAFLVMAAAIALSGCSAIQSVTGNSSVGADAIKGAQVAITTYADVYQPAVLAYGSLPLCPGATLCRDAALHAKLKAVDLAATKAILAAQKVMEGSVTDAGQVTAALQAVSDAEIAIASAGVALKH